MFSGVIKFISSDIAPAPGLWWKKLPILDWWWGGFLSPPCFACKGAVAGGCYSLRF